MSRKKISHTQILQTLYSRAKTKLKANNKKPDTDGLADAEVELLDFIASRSEDSKGVLTVIIASLVHKLFNPRQDIRKHQHNMRGGYSGRTVDTKYITPFLQEQSFPSMAESGWLTRSLEQNRPYDFNYPGKIRPATLKEGFLRLLDNVQARKANPEKYLIYLFQLLILQRERLVRPITRTEGLAKISVSKIVQILEKHFNHPYKGRGASRLPVLAIYSVYECMMAEIKRFEGKKLLPLEQHTSADLRSGQPGDIAVEHNGKFFEGVEVKDNIEITKQLASYTYSKFRKHPVKRYYLLSTANIKAEERGGIESIIKRAALEHNSQFIVNGVLDSLKYYLRLLENPEKFIEHYSRNVQADKAIKFEHKQAWSGILNEALAEISNG